jgi:glycosyltransferase involved in cell wall biosynthesis
VIKTLFLIQDEKMPSSRVRVLNLLPELEKAGINAHVKTYPRKIADKLGLVGKCRRFDIVFLQKKLPSPLDVILMRMFSRRFVFDFDDAIYYRHDAEESLDSSTRHQKFNFLMKRLDLVIAGNKVLSDYAGQCNKNIVIVPSAVETRNIPVKDYSVASEKNIIGWVGGGVNLHHLKGLSSLFQRLSREYPIELRIISNKTVDIPGVDVKFIPWKLESQEREIALFDIGVMPLPLNRHSEGKCGYKAVQYMAAAVPPVVSDVGVNRDIVAHGREGLVAKTNDEFYEALKHLMEDRSLRQEMGINARRKVEKLFSVEVVGRQLAETLRRAVH